MRRVPSRTRPGTSSYPVRFPLRGHPLDPSRPRACAAYRSEVSALHPPQSASRSRSRSNGVMSSVTNASVSAFSNRPLKWGGRGSNPRPMDYESTALTD